MTQDRPSGMEVSYIALAENVIDIVADELDLKPGRAAAVLAIALGTAMANGEEENATPERIRKGFQKTVKVIADAYWAEKNRMANPGAER